MLFLFYLLFLGSKVHSAANYEPLSTFSFQLTLDGSAIILSARNSDICTFAYLDYKSTPTAYKPLFSSIKDQFQQQKDNVHWGRSAFATILTTIPISDFTTRSLPPAYTGPCGEQTHDFPRETTQSLWQSYIQHFRNALDTGTIARL